jgi:hypothetical protein
MLGGTGVLSVLTATTTSSFIRTDRASEGRVGEGDLREELRAIRGNSSTDSSRRSSGASWRPRSPAGATPYTFAYSRC